MARPVRTFTFVRNLYHRLGIQPPNPLINRIHNCRNSFILLCLTTLFIISTAYLTIKCDTVANFGASFYVSISDLLYLIFWTMIIHRMTDIFTLIEKVDELIARRNDSTTDYSKMNDRIERMTKLIDLIFFKLQIIPQAIVFLARSIFNYLFLDLGEGAFELPLQALFPFNWKTPLGYFVAFLIEYIAMCAEICTLIPLLGLFIGMCWIAIAFARDLTDQLIQLSYHGQTHQRHVKLKANFMEILQLYSDARQIFDEFNRFFEYFVTAYILYSLVEICVSLLLIQIQVRLTENSASKDSLGTLNWFILAIVAIYYLFNSGEKVTEQFEIFTDQLYQCDWYLFPCEMQQMFVTFLSYSQHPVLIQGYGYNLTQCTRENFKKTIKTCYSYFMALRQMYR